jgi:hypothetical protein
MLGLSNGVNQDLNQKSTHSRQSLVTNTNDTNNIVSPPPSPSPVKGEGRVGGH